MSQFAASTQVSAAKSRAEIEQTLSRYGASAFGYATEESPEGGRAAVSFVAHGRQIRVIIALPSKSERRFTHTPTSHAKRTTEAAEKQWEQACRQKWRALALFIKAQLEAIESGLVSFEEAFLAHTVIPGTGRTVSEQIGAELTASIESGQPPRLALTQGTS